MSIDKLIIISSVLIGFATVVISGPSLGEMIATMAPIFHKGAALPRKELNIPYEEVAFQSTDGLTLRGWFIPSQNPNAPAIINAPATARDQRDGIALVRPFHNAGYHVLLFSYRGHGQSDGSPFGFTYGADESKDIDAAVAFLSREKGVRRIGLIGHSAGAVAAILSAARNPRIGAVVAASPYTSVEEIWQHNRPPFFPVALFDLTFKLVERRKDFSRQEVALKNTIGRIAPRPLLLVHSEDDRRISRQQVETQFSSAEEPKTLWLVKNASHGEVWSVVMVQQIEKVIAFFDRALR